MLKWFARFLKDDKAQNSIFRFLLLLVVVCFVFEWLYLTVAGEGYDLSWQKVSLIAGLFGLKVTQKAVER
jgi:hypothetical protein